MEKENNNLETDAPASEWSDLLDDNDLRIIREWFDCVADMNSLYLKKKDYILAKKIYEHLNFRVPKSILMCI